MFDAIEAAAVAAGCTTLELVADSAAEPEALLRFYSEARRPATVPMRGACSASVHPRVLLGARLRQWWRYDHPHPHIPTPTPTTQPQPPPQHTHTHTCTPKQPVPCARRSNMDPQFFNEAC